VILEAALSRISQTGNLCFWESYGTENGIRGISNSNLKVDALCPPLLGIDSECEIVLSGSEFGNSSIIN
jgi:hypothetical protein